LKRRASGEELVDTKIMDSITESAAERERELLDDGYPIPNTDGKNTGIDFITSDRIPEFMIAAAADAVAGAGVKVNPRKQ
jgi:hypothetical protein